MESRSIHVIQDENVRGRWILRAGSRPPRVFSTRKAATAEAKRILKDRPGQVVVLTRDGKIFSKAQGLPKIKGPVTPGKIDPRVIEKAVATVVKRRLASS